MTKEECVEYQPKTYVLEPENMLSSIETVLIMAEDSHLTDDVWEAMDPFLKYISELQGITINQALMLSIILEESSDGSLVTISNIARHLNCPNVRVMQFQKDIDVLVKRKMLKKTRRKFGNDIPGYVVTADMITAINNDRRFEPKPLKAKDAIHFFQFIAKLFTLRKDGEIDTGQMKEEFQELLEANADLHYVKALGELDLPINGQLLVTQMARGLVLNQACRVGEGVLGYLFDDDNEKEYELYNLELGEHILMKKNVLKHDGTDEFYNSKIYKLTKAAKEKLFKGIRLPKKSLNNVDVRKADSITEKELFFNEKVGLQMNNLSEMLTVEKMTAIQSRLKEHGRRTGFACLFYGSPGTGKTESVLQLAHKTGRDIMQVDMSAIKSKWVGESEQNIKAVFDNYRALCKTCKNTPILLFNEADAILGTRYEHTMHPTEKMDNAIQNIILQEMETLDGIMIATTNLEQSLDSAFERRFLYKVRFDLPDNEQRKRIWQSMLPSLNDEMAEQLAASYDFSGGQIENIVRKCDVESILYGESAVDDDKIKRFCQEESIVKKTAHIGFM